MEDELVGKIIEEFVRIRVKTYRYLIDDGSENKTAKDTKRCNIKTQLKFEDCKNCLEETWCENKMNHLEKNKIGVDSLKEDQKEFI